MAIFKKIPINNCPETGLLRAVTRKYLHIFEGEDGGGQVVLECFITHYKADGSVAKNVKPNAKKTLAAKTDQYVDPLNVSSRGRKWSEQEVNDYKQLLKDVAEYPDKHNQWAIAYDAWLESQFGEEPEEPVQPVPPSVHPITEFDYYYAMTQFPATIQAEEEKLINLRVLEGMFDKLDGEV